MRDSIRVIHVLWMTYIREDIVICLQVQNVTKYVFRHKHNIEAVCWARGQTGLDCVVDTQNLCLVAGGGKVHSPVSRALDPSSPIPSPLQCSPVLVCVILELHLDWQPLAQPSKLSQFSHSKLESLNWYSDLVDKVQWSLIWPLSEPPGLSLDSHSPHWISTAAAKTDRRDKVKQNKAIQYYSFEMLELLCFPIHFCSGSLNDPITGKQNKDIRALVTIFLKANRAL